MSASEQSPVRAELAEAAVAAWAGGWDAGAGTTRASRAGEAWAMVLDGIRLGCLGRTYFVKF